MLNAVGDLPMYIDILNEMASETASFPGNLPPSAHSCLKICYERASRVADMVADMMSKSENHSSVLSRSKYTPTTLEYAVQHFRQAVTLRRDTIMQ